ncbi:MAG: TonB-dependent receptor, partial [Acidobacteria bacterium]|nr:TonB-dependent receptor [Acidobacteriota bacterium]
FSYRVGSAIQKFDIMKGAGLKIDPYVQKTELDIMPVPNNNDIGDGLNYAGYRFNARSNDSRDTIYGKGDYVHSTKHVFAGTVNWVRDNADYTSAGNYVSKIPPVYLNTTNKLISGSWRWNPTPTITNELRGGFNRSVVPIETRNAKPACKHNVTFGYQGQWNRLYIYNDASTVALFTSGISNSSPYGFGQADIPGISNSDLSLANTLLPNLAGMIDSYTQSFNVTSRTSGFVPGATQGRNFSYNDYAAYVQDTWKIVPRFTLTLGVRYEYISPLDERDGLYLLPTAKGSYINAMMDPAASFDFAGGSSGRKFYKQDRNNFAPNLGFAWDVFGNGKTAVRGGYRVAYVVDDLVTGLRNSVTTNGGLTMASSKSNLAAFLSSPPAVVVPTFKVPRTSLDNFAINGTANAVGMPDPNLVTPYVQQWNFGIQHSVKDIIFEARYVGNHGTKLLRAIDFNQVLINQNGLLDDFKRAQGNAERSLAATGVYNPAYNASLAGSVPLTVISQTRLNLASTTVRNYIRTGQAGTLAAYAFTNGLNGPVQMFTNTSALGNNGMTNLSNSTFNALQLEARHTTRSGVFLQASYDWSKVLTDTLGGNNNQARFDPYLDNNNKAAERSRAPFDLKHNVKFNYVVPLPMGKGKFLDAGVLNRLVDGWSLGGIVNWQSGYPFSVLSARGTINRGPAGRSAWNTANSPLTGAQLNEKVGLFMTGNGPYFISPSVINTDGRGTTVEGAAAFANQIFTQPGAGTIGALQRRMFSGPNQISWDAQISKDTKIAERVSMVFSADFFNVMNHPTFSTGSEESSATRFTIDNTSFGKITGAFYDTRVIQFGLQLKF